MNYILFHRLQQHIFDPIQSFCSNNHRLSKVFRLGLSWESAGRWALKCITPITTPVMPPNGFWRLLQSEAFALWQ
jgi:hypothetical protein